MSTLIETVQRMADPNLPDAQVAKRLEKGKANHASRLSGWAESMAFYQNRQFVYRSAVTGSLNELDSRRDGKPSYRARTSRNRILGYVMSEISAGTQRIPGYEVSASTYDDEDVNAARLAEKVLIYLYDRLQMRKTVVDAYLYAVVCGEGFVRPFWHAGLGNALPQEPCLDCQSTGKQLMVMPCTACKGTGMEPELHEGDVAVEALGPHEVYWEPGVRFEKSTWLAVAKARSIDEIKALPNYNGADLKPDAASATTFVSGQLQSGGNTKGDLVVLTEYLELPSDKFKNGRRLFLANNHLVCEPEDYPMLVQGPQGYEHCIHKLPYFPTPDRDRDMGLVEHMIDAQRTLNDCVNKAIEWKNLAISPQILAPVGALRDRNTAEPGAVIKYNPVGGYKPEWRQVPPIPDSLFALRAQAIEDMEEIASQRSVPAQVEAGKAMATFIERQDQRRQFIIQALADFHGALGRHLLEYVQKFYTEGRLLKVNGRFGEESIKDFKGADLRGQVDVTVLPGSIEPRTKQAVEQKVMNWAQLGWIDPQKAMSIIEGGGGADLVDDYELDVAKQNREIQRMRALGTQEPGAEASTAEQFDNHEVHLGILHRWMKTADFEDSPPQVQEAARAHEAQHQQFLDLAAQKAQEQQLQQASQMGMNNAARPSQPKPNPSLPALPQT